MVASTAFTAALAVVGAAATIGGIGYGAFGEEGRVGPGFMPVFAGGLLMIFSLVDLIQRLRHKAATSKTVELALDTVAFDAVRPEATGENNPDIDIFGRTQAQRTRQLVVVIGILILTLLIVNVVGFIIAFGLMLIAIAVFVERRGWISSLIVSVVALGSAYLIFGVFLRVPLPQGLIGIF